MTATANIIKYSFPVYDDKLSTLVSVEKKDNEIILRYNKLPEEPTKSLVTIDYSQTKIVDFSK
jgi:hypothetical protein